VPGNSIQSEAQLTGRQRRRLRLARENGFLNAACRDPRKLLAAYGRWCWRLRIPMVWSERRSPHSRFGRVHFDLCTTAHRLTSAGQAELQRLGWKVTVSPHDARWDRVLLRDLDRLAAAAFRASTRTANREPARAPAPARLASLPSNVLLFEPARAASA
jgi:hypothetical protein